MRARPIRSRSELIQSLYSSVIRTSMERVYPIDYIWSRRSASHVTCRRNDRRAIFRDDRDRSIFLEKLRASLANYDVELHAYVLMGNHFHLLVALSQTDTSP